MSNFEKITKIYLKEFQDKYKNSQRSRSTSSELPTRPRVHKYIEDLINLCKANGSDPYVHHDTGIVSRDRPDWTIEDRASLGIYIFGDHKDLNLKDTYEATLGEIDQIQRYLSFGRPVFVFDGLEFTFFEGDIHNSTSYPLIEKSGLENKVWENELINSHIENIFRNLLGNPGFRKWSEQDLIKQLALYAQEIRIEFEQLLDAPLGSGLNAEENFLILELKKLQDLLKEGHDLGLADSENCASFVSQVLSFGLFYAHTNQLGNTNKPVERAKEILNFWQTYSPSNTNTNLRPIYEIANLLFAAVSRPNVLSVWFREVSNFLAHADYMGSISAPLDFHTLFETFLVHFDPKTRFDKGAFYTPQELTNWMVSFVDEVSQQHFGNSFLTQAESIIDPCCGTGGFLEAILSYSHQRGSRINGKLIGLEILPAPYALANYRLAHLLNPAKEFTNKIPSIYLTDSLSDNLDQLPRVKNNPFIKELEEASKETKPPLRVIIGNPPSTYETPANAKRDIINNKLNDFRPPENLRSGRQNIQKALSNEAWAFLRWSAEKIIESKEGIIGLVLPGAFSSHVSFEYARKWLVNNFDDIYILELDEDARRNIATKSLFKVLQGRLVLVAVCKAQATGRKHDHLAKIFHLDISEYSLEKKKEFLSKEKALHEFIGIEFSNTIGSFTPTKAFDEDLWDISWPILPNGETEGIFESKCSAIKLAPSSALFHVDSSILVRRSSDLKRVSTNKNFTINEYIERWFKGQRKSPNADKYNIGVMNEIINASSSATSIKKYNYRPFLDGYVLYSEKLFQELGDAPGGGTRSRPEVRKAFEAGAIAITIAPSPEDIGSDLHRFVSFSWQLPDNDLAARGNGMVYSTLRAIETPNGGYKISENVNQKLKSLFEKNDDYIFYIYAILTSNTYQKVFHGKLFSSSSPNDPIRVPILSDRVERNELALLGRELAKYEKIDTTIHEDIKSQLDVRVNFLVGQEDFKLKSMKYDGVREEICLLSENGLTIQISGVTDEIYKLKISGHSVMEKWIQYRKFSYLNRGLEQSDIDSFVDLIERLNGQLDLITKADKKLLNLLTSSNLVHPQKIEP